MHRTQMAVTRFAIPAFLERMPPFVKNALFRTVLLAITTLVAVDQMIIFVHNAAIVHREQ
jgi:hypothetical protein